MSRISDVELGARIAWDAATSALIQPDLFGGTYTPEFWKSIELAALDQLDECDALKAVMS